MKRFGWMLALVCGVSPPLHPWAWGQDEVRFYNRKAQKEETLKGTIISENPARVTLRLSASRTEEIPAADILEIDYQPPPAIGPLSYRQPLSRERRAAADKINRRKLLLEALELYNGLLPKMAEAKFQLRHARFHCALIQASLSEGDPARLDGAIDALKKFTTEQGDGWQLVPAVKLLVRLLEQKGDNAAALATYQEFAGKEALPREARREFGMLTIRYLLRLGKNEEAARQAKVLLASLPGEDPQAERVQVYLLAGDTAAGRLEGVAGKLQAVVQGSADHDVKALARNTLGDYYRAKGQLEDAFWQYLWVDIYYNQDREELAKALYYLSKLFLEVRKDTVRSRECLDRLLDERTFGGLEYYKRALAEKPVEDGT